MENVKERLGNQFLIFDYPTLPETVKLKAETELHETDQKRREGLIEIKKYIEKKGIPFDTENEDFMVAFLRGRKYEMKRVLDTIYQYSLMRHTLMNYYGFINMSAINVVLEKKMVSLLPYRDAEGRIILYAAGGIWRSNICDAADVTRTVQILFHYILSLPLTTVCGLTAIINVGEISLEEVYAYLKIIKLLVPTLSAFPIRIQRVDVYNMTPMFRLLLLMIKHLIPTKLFKRIHFHGRDLEVFKQYPYHSSIMPNEFGGTLGPLSVEPFIDKLEKYVTKLKSSNIIYKRNDTIPFPET